MQFLELTCDTAAEDLALDEALLERAERDGAIQTDDAAQQDAASREVLRIWEMRRPTVVLGRSSQFDVEVRADECRRRGVDVLRRTSGGAAIVGGPGCLMYSVVLSYAVRPHLRAVDEAHRFVLGSVLRALRPQVPDAALCGTSDLAVGLQKFSGNSLRCRREYLLYHGTILYDFPTDLVAACLGTPPRQPDYRAGRSHDRFVANVAVDRAMLVAALAEAFEAREPATDVPWEIVRSLVDEKYARAEWNEGRK